MVKIQVRELTKIFGNHPERGLELLRAGKSKDEILDKTGQVVGVIDASFDVQEGEIFVVMGLSGSGKSTLVRMLNRLIEPTSGSVEIDGANITNLSAQELRDLRAKKMSMVFQRFALFPHRTVMENAAFGLEVQKLPLEEREQRAKDALQMVGLNGWETNFPSQLSGGMQQRVGLARALATDADVLLMDEAFSALDPLIRREIQDQLIDLQQTLRKTIVFITHDLNEAMRLGDRIAMMRDGAIVQIGTAEEILNEPANEYVAAFVQDVDRSKVITAGSIMRDPRATVSIKDGPSVAMHQMREHQVTEMYVLCAQRRMLKGMVRDRDVAEAAKRGDRSIETIVIGGCPTVGPDAAIGDLFGLSVEQTLPVAVIDEDSRLLGVVPRISLLRAFEGVVKPDGA
jgi:glycine betaine/proline transport system ATP-binding protein